MSADIGCARARGTASRLRKLVTVALTPRYLRAMLRAGVAASTEHEHVRFAFDHRTIIDVGAGRGQFALFALELFPRATVHCFEPGAASFAVLEHVTKDEARVKRHQYAIGAATGSATLTLARDADSSSILPFASQARVFPGSDPIGEERVAVRRLDDQIPDQWDRPALLKIDVQGAELAVLAGASRVLERTDEVFIELSYVELYEGQPRADEVITMLERVGFHVAQSYPAAISADGAVVQADVRLVRSAATPR